LLFAGIVYFKYFFSLELNWNFMNSNKTFLFLITYFLLFVGNESFGQGRSDFGILIGASGELGGSRQVLTDDFRFLQNYQNVEEGRLFAYSLGVDAGLRVGKVYVLSGVSFIRRGALTKARILGQFYEPNTNSTEPRPDPDVFVNIEDRTRMNYLRVPILLGYAFGGDNFKIRLSTGIAFNSSLGRNADFSRSASYPEPGNLDLPRTLSSESSFDGFRDGFLYGTNTNERYKPSLVSFVFNPSLLFRLNDYGFLNMGIMYENFGRVINGDWRYSGTNVARGKTTMSAFMFHLGYEYKLDFGTTVTY
jgi:hypothetical protein